MPLRLQRFAAQTDHHLVRFAGVAFRVVCESSKLFSIRSVRPNTVQPPALVSQATNATACRLSRSAKHRDAQSCWIVVRGLKLRNVGTSRALFVVCQSSSGGSRRFLQRGWSLLPSVLTLARKRPRTGDRGNDDRDQTKRDRHIET